MVASNTSTSSNFDSDSNSQNLIKIHKVIARRGITSNRKAEDLIKQGRVRIEGRAAQIGELVRDDVIITIDEKKYLKNHNFKHTTFIMNKKIGVECSRKPFKNIYLSIFSHFNSKEEYFNSLKCVGRLDVLTSGLIIITTNSQLSQKIIHPSSNIIKTYIVGLDNTLNEKYKSELLNKGIIIEHSISKPLSISKLDYSKFNSNLKEQIKSEQLKSQRTTQKLFWYEIKVSEGKKHIIRKFFEYYKYKVKALHRTKIGNLDLTQFNLNQGSFKKIDEEQLLGLIFNNKLNKKVNNKFNKKINNKFSNKLNKKS